LTKSGFETFAKKQVQLKFAPFTPFENFIRIAEYPGVLKYAAELTWQTVEVRERIPNKKSANSRLLHPKSTLARRKEKCAHDKL
jgi:hypothetical protein